MNENKKKTRHTHTLIYVQIQANLRIDKGNMKGSHPHNLYQLVRENVAYRRMVRVVVVEC